MEIKNYMEQYESLRMKFVGIAALVDDGNGQGNAEQFQAQARQNYVELATDFLKLYPASTNEEAGASGLARIRDEFGWYMRTFAQAEAKAGKKAYVYHFTRVAPGQTRGATHTAELTYMFQNPSATGWSDVDHKLADQMSTYWVNFAATGDPNGQGLPSWPVYDAKKNDGQGMVFGDTTQFGPQIEVARLKFFDRVYTGLQAR
jgi:para-nitrobenzyl esterase